ncbi:MAG: hypothetical protein R3F49_18630 [Planctomycetota bacterium]
MIATIGVVVVAALGVAVMTQKAKSGTNDAATVTAPGPTPGSNPFADINTDPEALMRKSSGGGSKRPPTTNNAPPGLADSPIFAEARTIAKEATELVNAALAAEKAGDVETWRTKAIAGRDKLDHVLEMTADWEIGLIEQWGSNEAQLIQISREIDVWRKLLTKVRKVH